MEWVLYWATKKKVKPFSINYLFLFCCHFYLMQKPSNILKINSGADAPTSSLSKVTAICVRGIFLYEKNNNKVAKTWAD